MKNYVKEYKGYNVPEGATHWLVNGFAKGVDNKSISVIGCFQGVTGAVCFDDEQIRNLQSWMIFHKTQNDALKELLR